MPKHIDRNELRKIAVSSRVLPREERKPSMQTYVVHYGKNMSDLEKALAFETPFDHENPTVREFLQFYKSAQGDTLLSGSYITHSEELMIKDTEGKFGPKGAKIYVMLHGPSIIFWGDGKLKNNHYLIDEERISSFMNEISLIHVATPDKFETLENKRQFGVVIPSSDFQYLSKKPVTLDEFVNHPLNVARSGFSPHLVHFFAESDPPIDKIPPPRIAFPETYPTPIAKHISINPTQGQMFVHSTQHYRSLTIRKDLMEESHESSS